MEEISKLMLTLLGFVKKFEPFPPFAGGAALPLSLFPLLGRFSAAAAAAASGVTTLNLTLMSILVGFEIRMRSTTPRPI